MYGAKNYTTKTEPARLIFSMATPTAIGKYNEAFLQQNKNKFQKSGFFAV